MVKVIPFVVEGWHAHPLAAGLEPLASCPGQADWNGTAGGCQKKPGPGRQVVSKDNQQRQPNSRSGRDPGPRPYAATRPNQRKQGRRTNIHILPAEYEWLMIG